MSTSSSPKLVAFPLYLHQDFNLSLSLVKGYKAMLNSVFCLKGFDFSTDQVLWEVIHACGKQAHRNTARVASWNVDVILHHSGLYAFRTIVPILSLSSDPEDSVSGGSSNSQKSWVTTSAVNSGCLPW